uniref:Small ribosomal subunit protein uS15 N-terminal domain-containing protein n=1 Tax=Lactuca sativa TaxID=4236 RepID=A0A9R1XMC9_LACSA|nr:hypothetical protein LSAT_V11C200078860 [Lactuca sativa]
MYTSFNLDQLKMFLLCISTTSTYLFSLTVQDSIYKFAKKGLTPSQIGVILRDSHGIAQVNSVTRSKILRILKAHGMHSLNLILIVFFNMLMLLIFEDMAGLAPEILEDLYHLIRKEIAIRKHLQRNRKDKDPNSG